jgi:osmotically-inducible protein OsmY
MNGSVVKLQWVVGGLVLLVFGASLMATLPRRQAMEQTATANASRSEDPSIFTADQQKMSAADRALTQKIRKAIHHDTRLSVEGRNIRIFTQDGKVTLRGPVRSEEEKVNLNAKAAAAAGDENVTNELKVTPSK